MTNSTARFIGTAIAAVLALIHLLFYINEHTAIVGDTVSFSVEAVLALTVAIYIGRAVRNQLRTDLKDN